MIPTLWRVLAGGILIAMLTIAASLSLSLATITYAAQTKATHFQTPVSVPQKYQAQGGHVTIITLDMSGSMGGSGGNDPNGLRCSAADAYIDLSGSDPNDYIGLIGLDNNSGKTTGTHNFLTAQDWQTPLNVATIQNRNQLKQTITQKSNSCSPDGYTPTYNALNDAYTMLQSATKQPGVTSGSVILLTDGIPCPNVDEQINAIKSDLLPKFQAAGWPIDTIGLGENAAISSGSGCSPAGTLPGTFHDFLHNDIANATGGTFYDDGNGPVQGISPLNIATFFADIFAKYSGRILHPDIPVTMLNGALPPQNFTVVDGTSELDVLAVRENQNIQIQLQDPQQQDVSPLSSDAYHVIYRIMSPTPGPWILSASGSGRFLMDDFQQTNIGLQVDRVGTTGAAAPHPLPLGQPITVQAHLETNGQSINDNAYRVTEYISYNGNNSCANPQSSQSAVLQNNGGTYSGTFTVDDTQSAGSYTILLCATANGSLENVIASQVTAVQLELFPIPFLLSPQSGQPTGSQVSQTVVRWPLPFKWYSAAAWLTSLSSWPLQGLPPVPATNLIVEVQQHNGLPYSGGSLNNTTVTDMNGKTIQPTIVPDGPGKFLLQFEPSIDGTATYKVDLKVSGTYEDSHGVFNDTVRSAQITLVEANSNQIGTATWRTFLYLAILAGLLLFAKFIGTPTPYGGWACNPGVSEQGWRRFKRAPRIVHPWQFIWHRNWLNSKLAGMPAGLIIRFNRGRRIEACPDGSKQSVYWRTSGGSQLRPKFQRVELLIFAQPGQDATRDRYVIKPTIDNRTDPHRRPHRSSTRGTKRGGTPRGKR